ncbi:MAG: pectate lyase [Acidobacteria bacterium]|nr:MAG: pectate lyase [Acidobacteriota bacterium]
MHIVDMGKARVKRIHRAKILTIVLIIVALWLESCQGSSSIALSVDSPSDGALPAFPGAEGFGAYTPGGRGGRVFEVTNLNDSGPGSLRAALEASGRRIVVFRIGGIIELQGPILVTEPYLTVAGQTAPGDGIALRNAGIQIVTHDVIIRGLRIRPGDTPTAADPRLRDGIWIGMEGHVGAENVIIDHCSVSWGVDENISVTGASRNITVQWCISSEGLMDSLHPKGIHSMGLLVGNGTAERVSIHHNLIVHNNERNPRIADGSMAELVNNVIYNWGKAATVLETKDGGPAVNIVGNIYLPGPDGELDFVRRDGIQRKEIDILPPGGRGTIAQLYLKDNIGPHRPTNEGDEGMMVSGRSSDYLLSSSPVVPPSGITVDDVSRLVDVLLPSVGAIVPTRDPVDVRIVEDVRNGTGGLIDSPVDVGGYPTMNPGTAPSDSDHDGMPDAWERAHGLDPYNPQDGNGDLDGDGYTNVEEYLNEFFERKQAVKRAPLWK